MTRKTFGPEFEGRYVVLQNVTKEGGNPNRFTVYRIPNDLAEQCEVVGLEGMSYAFATKLAMKLNAELEGK